MYPQCPLPRHITALYVVAVASCLALFSRSVGRVGANVLVYSLDANILAADFHDAPARFGALLPDDGLKGMLVYAEPATACQPVSPPPRDTANPLGKWVVLIRRYGCSFVDKVRHAQGANYSAAIVHNVNSSDLEPMAANHPEAIHIPSVFVSEEAGYVLRVSYLYNTSYYVLINEELPFNFNAHLLLPFAVVVGICFMVMVIFMMVKCIKDRRRQSRHRLPSSSLRKIPTAKFQKGDPYETCAICLEDYKEGDRLRILPCSHAYHCKCIDPWLTRNRRVCPVCKRKVFAHDEHLSDTDSDTDTDDTTPLVRPGSHGTQGGTFVAQQENPLQRANHLRQSGSMSSLSSYGSNHGAVIEAPLASQINERLPGQVKQVQPVLLESSPSSASTSLSESLYGSPSNSRGQVRSSSPNHVYDGEDEDEEEEEEEEEELLSYNLASSGEHSINGPPPGEAAAAVARFPVLASDVAVVSARVTDRELDVVV